MPQLGTPAVWLDATAAPDEAPLPWAWRQLAAALTERGVVTWGTLAGTVPAGTVAAEQALSVRTVVDGTHPEEGFAIAADARGLVVSASGPRGLAYGLTELADRVRHGVDAVAALRDGRVAPTAPATPVRGVLRSFSSDVLDLGWFRDPEFWTAYLDELATHRINRIHLALGMQYNYSHDPDVRDNYLCFAYPFLVSVPGWEGVHADGVDAEERAANLRALRFASDEAARRGIHFQLGLWNHAVAPELGESPHLRYRIGGLAADDVARYSATALHAVLVECPSIAGVTFRVHYEGGVPEAGHGEFWRTVMSGFEGIDRPLDVDMHAKGVDAELVDVARATGARVVISAKYWAEHQGLPYHQASVRALEKARPANDDALRGVTQNERRFTRYGYGDFLGEQRDYDVLFRVWPGSQRFLLWADPEIFAGYGRESTIGGAIGAELCEPLTFRGRKDTGRDGVPRDLYVDPRLALGRDDWRKYSYEYRLWGRLLYDPAADEDSRLRELRSELGAAADPLASALSAAGKILPLVTVTQSLSASNNFFWPEVPTDMPIARNQRSETYDFDLAAPGTWGGLSPFDPLVFENADDFAKAVVDGRASGRVTPDDVATTLERLASDAESALAHARVASDAPAWPVFQRSAIDVTILAGLGRFWAGKVRAGIGYALTRATGDPVHLAEALAQYRAGRDALASVVDAARDVYAANLAFGDRPSEQGHWTDRLTQVDADLKALSEELDELLAAGGQASPALGAALPPAPARAAFEHTPVAAFEHGEPLEVRARLDEGLEGELHVRHLNQGEEYLVLTMARDGADVVATVPGEYTAAFFPLEYYVVVRTSDGGAAIFPGLDRTLSNRPYHLVPGSKLG